MGNGQGSFFTSGFALACHPDVIPGPYDEPSFDPHLGFDNPRKERVMIATKEEMVSAKLPLEDRDYCAHLLLKYRSCRKDVWPFAVKCAHENHAYLTCKYEDFVLRMKEYERERRLRERAKKLGELSA